MRSKEVTFSVESFYISVVPMLNMNPPSVYLLTLEYDPSQLKSKDCQQIDFDYSQTFYRVGGKTVYN